MNRAVQGDFVVVEVFDKTEWKAPADEVVDQEGFFFTFISLDFFNGPIKATLKNDDAEESGEENEEDDILTRESKVIRSRQSKAAPAERQPTGRIIGIIKRNWRA